MLELLRIKNFAVIKQQEIEFAPGLNVITGETGAGKSVLLQGLSLILGGRPKAKYVRKGAECWEIEAVFNLKGLAEQEFDGLPEIAKTSERELILYRSAGATRSRVLINGHLGSITLLQEITRRIINICGQGEFVTLLDPKRHIVLLDQFARHDNLVADVKAAYRNWHTADQKARSLAQLREVSLLRRAELEFIIQDLSPIEWRSGLRQELEDKLSRLNNSETLITSIQGIVAAISAPQGIEENVQAIQADLLGLVRKDSSLTGAIERARAIKAEVEELAEFLDNYLSGLDLNEEELDQIRDQLALVAALERKYRKNDQALAEFLAESQQALTELENLPDQEQADQQVVATLAELTRCCTKLTTSRKKAATALSTAIVKELQELSMPDTLMSVEFTTSELSENGAERVEFLASTNKGQDAQQLRLIASGGELSRILLVMKKLLRDQTGVNVLVFDEVDSGVSGKVARSVGEKLKSLAENSQVLCITHLAQVASLADHHLAVQKLTEQGLSIVKTLHDEPEKVEEIAKLLAGYEVTAAVRESARELLRS